jgi:hypothetical protein
MADPYINKRTLLAFREYMRTWSYREIAEEFELAGITQRNESVPEEQSKRRTLIEQYYACLDVSSKSDMQRLLAVFQGALSRLADGNERSRLIRFLEADGFSVEDGRISSGRLSNTGDTGFRPKDPEPLLTTLARLFAASGAAREVAVLAQAHAAIEQTDYDNWNGGTDIYTLYLKVPMTVYNQLGEQREAVEEAIHKEIQPLMRAYPNDRIGGVQISVELSTDPNWREKAQAWASGKNITNQGRVRSNNIASRSCDGLLFRSQPEIFLYQALKSAGVSFAPLPVFVRGGAEYRRIEPDFVLLKEGVVMIVEVDGDTVHQETPAEAHDRTTMLLHEGALVERIKASDCDTQDKAKACAQKLMQVLKKRKDSK